MIILNSADLFSNHTPQNQFSCIKFYVVPYLPFTYYPIL